MPLIDADFEVWQAITLERKSEADTENAVLRRKYGLPSAKHISQPSKESLTQCWVSDGARIPVGLSVRHRFRDGTVHTAQVTASGVLYDGITHQGFSPAGVASCGTDTNGWHYWEFQDSSGHWRKVDHFRKA